MKNNLKKTWQIPLKVVYSGVLNNGVKMNTHVIKHSKHMKEQKIRINADIFREYWSKESNCIAFELSDSESMNIYLGSPSQNAIVVENTTSGNARRFEFVQKDTDGSGEDTYGWRYKSKDGIKLLIIND